MSVYACTFARQPWYIAMVNIPHDGVASTKKRVAVLLDGTWDTVNDNTSVWRLKSLLASQGRDGLEQISYYSVGVGTAFEHAAAKAFWLLLTAWHSGAISTSTCCHH